MEPFPTEIDEIVRQHFTIVEWKIQFGILTYVVKDEDTKSRFLKLYSILDTKGYVPVLRNEYGKKVLRVFKRQERPRHRPLWNIVLLLATMASVTFAGYLFTMGGIYETIDPSFGKYRILHLIAYVASIFFVLGVHELGHKIACTKHNLKSTPPYFIPGPPEIGGSLGAVMIQETPILNRDQLFDLGLTGPLLSFIASIIVTFVGLSLSYFVPEDLVLSWIEQGQVSVLPLEPLLFAIIRTEIVSLLQTPFKQALIIHPIAFAGWVGMLITFLNTLPVGQLDGGHVTRALLDSRKHIFVSIIAVVIMIMTGFIFMAFVALLILFRGHPGPLDDVSPLSRSRRVLFILLPIMCGLCFSSITFRVL
ncbi:MAG: site-2 protease family protein [Candidatus Nezhaarchaeales archaeon]